MDYADLLRCSLRQSVPVRAALGQLRDSGASPAEAAQALSAVTGAGHDDAALQVRQSGAWEAARGTMAAASARPHTVGRHGRSGHGAATVLPYLVLPYVSPGRRSGQQRQP